ncbi:MAG: hypothetical protein LC793_12325 [Thermomicrobia bacterium]|nr:hypothetical protein [Thermomicrobia bacterium]
MQNEAEQPEQPEERGRIGGAEGAEEAGEDRQPRRPEMEKLRHDRSARIGGEEGGEPLVSLQGVAVGVGIDEQVANGRLVAVNIREHRIVEDDAPLLRHRHAAVVVNAGVLAADQRLAGPEKERRPDGEQAEAEPRAAIPLPRDDRQRQPPRDEQKRPGAERDNDRQ